jgi:hypothetical protein
MDRLPILLYTSCYYLHTRLLVITWLYITAQAFYLFIYNAIQHSTKWNYFQKTLRSHNLKTWFGDIGASLDIIITTVSNTENWRRWMTHTARRLIPHTYKLVLTTRKTHGPATLYRPSKWKTTIIYITTRFIAYWKDHYIPVNFNTPITSFKTACSLYRTSMVRRCCTAGHFYSLHYRLRFTTYRYDKITTNGLN